MLTELNFDVIRFHTRVREQTNLEKDFRRDLINVSSNAHFLSL